MNNSAYLRRAIAKFALIFLLALSIGIGFQITRAQLVVAQSDTAVRSEINSLSTRVNRLENDIRSLMQSGSRTTRPINPSEPSQIASSDPMFERLANLTIELKERITGLEKRVTQIEEKIAKGDR
jgi:polyhydroxyalkanoate synthesis regulator phasin